MLDTYTDFAVRGWVNVYLNSRGAKDVIGVYDTRAEADREAANGRVACIYVTGMEGYLGHEKEEG